MRRLRERFAIVTARQTPHTDGIRFIADSWNDTEPDVDSNGRDWSQVGGRTTRNITLKKMLKKTNTKPVTPEPKEEPELSESQENLRRVIREYLNKPHDPEFIWDHKPIRSDRAIALGMSVRAAQIPYEKYT